MLALLILAALLLGAAGCTAVERLPLPPAATPTPTPPAADEVAAEYFRAWEQRQYAQMYDLLADAARAATSRETFLRRYTNIEQGIGLVRTTIQAQPALAELAPTPSPAAGSGAATAADARRARVPFQVTRRVALFGDLAESSELPLVQEQGQWKVAWQPSLLFRELTTTSTVLVLPDAPRRGRILDRAGQPLAEDGPTALTVGVVPGQVQDEAAVRTALSETLGLDPETVARRSQGGQPDWFMPIADRPLEERAQLAQALGGLAGVVVREKLGRVYPLGEAAAHAVGYVGRVTAEELASLREQGYDEDDWRGRTGVEAWAERALAGQKGGRIVIQDEQGRVVRTIAERAAVPGSDVRLTLDARIQERAAAVLGERTGGVVVLDPRDGAILALASRPSFDPNALVRGLAQAEWQALNQNGAFVLRATESAYPPASTFKVVTMAAGLERGGVKTTDTFDCGLEWRGLPGLVLENWTRQGVLDLVEALAESCNPAFYEIGLKLDRLDPSILPGFARAFGFGRPTGVQGVDEVAGLVPDPDWQQRQLGQPWASGDSVNLAIGQGALQVTPLQLANAYAALANGGTLRTPLLVRSIERPDGTAQTFTSQEKGPLPLSPATRVAILEGMKRVTSTPNGTASAAFRGERTPTAAKTGSAENAGPNLHAWFVGFQTPEQPRLLALVLVEGGQMGGLTAAPLARQVLDAAYPLQR